MTARYRFDPGQGRFTVQAFAAGMLSMLGHSPTFAVRDFAGTLRTDGDDLRRLGVEVTVRADALELLDDVKPADRDEIQRRLRRDVLEVAAFPEIHFRTLEFEAQRLEAGHYRLFLGGQLTLHGVTNPFGTDAELWIFPDGGRLRGGGRLRMSPYRIGPVSALGGTIRLKDELALDYDLVAVPEGS